MSISVFVGMVSQVFAYVRTHIVHSIVHFKYVQFFVYGFYFNKAIQNICKKAHKS